MFEYDFTDELRKKLIKLAKKDKVLAINFQKKLNEIISKDKSSINIYKNLKTPMSKYKRIHLTDNMILLFEVKLVDNFILFVDIKYSDIAYKDRS